MSDSLENFGKNDFSDELTDQSIIEDVQELDDYIETGTFFETGLDGIDFSNDNKVNNLLQIDNPNKFVENSFKRQYKTVKKIESHEKMEVLEKLENTMECREVNVKDGSHFNDTPEQDIQEAFDYVDIMFDKNSTEWQENACRYVEVLESKLSEIAENYDELKMSFSEISVELNKIVIDNEFRMNRCDSYTDGSCDFFFC